MIQPAPASKADLAAAVEFLGHHVLGNIVPLKDNVASIRLAHDVGLRGS